MWKTIFTEGFPAKQTERQNDSSLVLHIIREVLIKFGGAMHKVAPP